MPFCPECSTEHTVETPICPDCQVELVPAVAPTQLPEAIDWYAIESVPNEVAGNILKSVLETEGIDVYLRCNEMPAYGGAIMGNVGKSEWGDILVPVASISRARACLKNYFDSLLEVRE